MSYRVNEIFYSLQGEGMRAGQPSIFLRFSGCNLACSLDTHGFDCDTEFVSGRPMTIDEILEELSQCGSSCSWVVLTGGEPALQVDAALVTALHDAGYQIAMETNGSIDVSGLAIDWLTVSPKVAEHSVRQLTAHEVKYVRGHGQGIPKPKCHADHYLISPATSGLEFDTRAVDWCVQLVRDNPSWRLSLQLHKVWGVR